MPTRHYFHRAVAPTPKPPPTNHHNKYVVGKVVSAATGTITSRTLGSGYVARLLGNQKGGLVAAAKGTAHRWTSEEARKAAKKLWKKKKVYKWTGTRRGMATNRRERVSRVPLRAKYAGQENACKGIYYNPETQLWMVRVGRSPLAPYCISERTALSRLGYIKKPNHRKFVPETVVPTMQDRHSNSLIPVTGEVT